MSFNVNLQFATQGRKFIRPRSDHFTLLGVKQKGIQKIQFLILNNNLLLDIIIVQ